MDSAKIRLILRMPDPGVPEELVIAAVRNLMYRHEALRTIYPTDQSGAPFQLVLDQFETPTPFCRDGNEIEDIDAVFHALFAPPMDQAVELPLRVGLTFKDRRVATVILVLNHIAVDGTSVDRIAAELTGYLSVSHEKISSSTDDQKVNMQPLAVARRQSTGRAPAHERAMRYCENVLSSSPAAQFPRFRFAATVDPRQDVESCYHRVVLQSPALFSALRKLSKNSGFSVTNYLSAVFTVAISALSGNSRATLRMNFSNRFQEVRQSVGCFFQEALLSVHILSQVTMSEVMAETKQRILVATRHAQYSYLSFRDRKARIEADRGLSIRLGTVLNCGGRFERNLRGPVSTERTAGERPSSTMKRLECLWRDEYTDLCLRSSALNGEVHLDLIAHRSVIEQDQIEKMLTAMEQFLVAWADEPDLATATVADVVDRFGLPASSYDERWAHVDHSWVNTAKLANIVSSVDGIEAALVSVVERPSEGRTLVARLVGDPSRQDQVRAHVLASLRENADLMCPHEFVWCDELPESGSLTGVGTTASGNAAGAADVPVGPEKQAGGAGYEALAAALEIARGDASVDMDCSYIQQGGSAVMAPAVMKQLNQLGFEGPTPDDLMGPWPLRAVAELCVKRVSNEC
ncbi:condensation domain-containing protein [Streptomyces sp. NPDC019937]|uniref:condensation domain-containing protein n=1 Tax=Streptomyces sp. NPDC019937 TaxID=3154787 RepID=UPI00340FFBE6